MPFRSVTTVLLDVDGTLLDTHEFILGAYEHACAEAGLAAPTREWLAMQVGRELEHVYRDISPAQVAELVERHRLFQLANLALATPFPGTAETLAKLKDAGMVLAAVTSRSRRTLPQTIEMNGLAPYFSAIVAAEDVPKLKPEPEPLLFALELLGRPIASAVMVGDSVHDIRAGKAAGMPTIAVTYGFPGRTVLDANPDASIDDIRDLATLLLPAIPA